MLAGFQSSLLAVGVSSLFLLAAAQIPSQQYGYNPSDQLYGGKQDIDLEKVCALYGVRETGPIKVIVEDAFGRRYGNYYGCISAEGKWVTKCPSLEVYHDSTDMTPRLSVRSDLGRCGLFSGQVKCGQMVDASGLISVIPETRLLKNGRIDFFYADNIPNENMAVTLFQDEGNHKVRVSIEYFGTLAYGTPWKRQAQSP